MVGIYGKIGGGSCNLAPRGYTSLPVKPALPGAAVPHKQFVCVLDVLSQFKVIEYNQQVVLRPVQCHELFQLLILQPRDLSHKKFAETMINIFILFLLQQSFLQEFHVPVVPGAEHINDGIKIETNCKPARIITGIGTKF